MSPTVLLLVLLLHPDFAQTHLFLPVMLSDYLMATAALTDHCRALAVWQQGFAEAVAAPQLPVASAESTQISPAAPHSG